MERVCKTTADGRLAVEVGNRTLFLDNVPIYEQLSAEKKWQFWDADESGVASEEEIEAGILKLQSQGVTRYGSTPFDTLRLLSNFFYEKSTASYLLIFFAAGSVLWAEDTPNNNQQNQDPLEDFRGEDVEENWMTVNDNVMGGRSKGGFSVKKVSCFFQVQPIRMAAGFLPSE